jgi:glycosyltransferase involved in cell wall biosynthesis
MLEQAHVLVLPTWYPWEGQPLSIIEAMAYGTPVISTEHAGIPEQIVHNQTGWMLPANQINAEQLSRFLSQLIHLSPTDYQAMSAAAIEFYQHNFTRERHLARMLEVINAC